MTPPLLLRNLFRRPLRTALTVAGIAIGIWTLVVFSAMAAKIESLVRGGAAYFEGKVIVSDEGVGRFANLPIRVDAAAVLATAPGVEQVVPQVEISLEDEVARGFAVNDLLVGIGAGAAGDGLAVRAATGRLLERSDHDRWVAVLGADIARKWRAVVGQQVTVRGRSFEVVGILEATLSLPDTAVFVPLHAAQAIYHADLPPVLRDALDVADVASQLVAYPEPGADPEAVAAAIEAVMPGVAAESAADFVAEVGATTAIFNAIIVGIGLISLVVGGLSVVNTMTMTVAERTRELGVRRAIGASRFRVVREVVHEAGVIGLIGGIAGLALGVAFVIVANEVGRSTNVMLFELTVGTAVQGLAFSTVLGALAGLAPAWTAARLDPVTALRYE